MTYSEVEKKKRASMAQMKYQAKRLEESPGACYWSGCKEARAVKDGRQLNYCSNHGQIRAEWQRAKYHAMLEAFQKMVRVTETPRGADNDTGPETVNV